MTVRSVMELTCQEVVERISDLLGDALSLDDRGRLEQHLLICPPCTLHVRQVRTTIELAGELRAPAAVPAAAVIDAFRAWKAR